MSGCAASNVTGERCEIPRRMHGQPGPGEACSTPMQAVAPLGEPCWPEHRPLVPARSGHSALVCFGLATWTLLLLC